ncbi:kinase-like protein [Coniochaeta ligniaria NRRL 30616]|uniref:Kinase-like protein n=1 Tax=Coniochaeta ligniaria NRRL 30616 TaxID=1408157 RepID=A0A1J7IA74_9PEZI|nr:kinase-like protein [Coniochaeta ligniaria NRRL 30616]
MKRSDVCQREFLPRHQLVRLVNKPAVEAELRRSQYSIIKRIQTLFDSSPSDRNLSAEAQKICGTTHHQSWGVHLETDNEHIKEMPAPKEKTYRGIFAILVLIGRPSRIRDFVEEEVCDADLPLEAPNKAKPWDLRRKKVPDKPLHCFSRWRHNTVKSFEERQWTVYAPFLGQDERRLPLFFQIPHRTVLPFTKWERKYPAGGYGQVYRAEIHPDHHAFQQVIEGQTPQKQVFAIKQLSNKSEPDFRKEFVILRTVSKIGHPHLISLLGAYEHQEYFHFIFPWAAADLATYWQENKPKNDVDTPRWLAEQCAGLAGGLSTIHYRTLSGDSLRNATASEGILGLMSNEPPATSQTGIDGPRDMFLLHGDIKRENILWFPDNTPGSGGGCLRGTLKITDFGTSKLMTHDDIAWKRPQTCPIYRPPEADLKLSNSSMGTSYDIWGLGCLYLEFAAWCFGGWDQIQAFLSKRWMRDHRFYKFHTGTFFQVIDDENGTLGARVKPGVSDVSPKPP